MATATVPDRLLTEAEAAELLGLKQNTLNNWRCTHRVPLPYVRVGRAIRYRLADIQAFIERGTVRPGDID